MARTFVVNEDTDLDTLARSLLDARVRASQTAAALARFKEVNPHVDPKRLAAGTVLVVPDTVGLKPSAGEPAFKGPRDSLRSLAEAALGAATERSGARLEARLAERGEIANALKGALRRATKAGDDSADQLKEAAGRLADDARADAGAQTRLAAMGAAALAAFERLDKLDR